jgi:hypothetical protein
MTTRHLFTITDPSPFVVIFERGPASVGAYVPALPGCVAVGRTLEEAQALIVEAMQMHLAGMQEDREESTP